MPKSKSKLTLDALHRAEKAGVRVVVDASQWHGKDRRICPILTDVSPTRCDLVTEARRLTDILEKRPKAPPEGVVYGIATDRLEVAIAMACAYIDRHMREQTDAKSAKDSAASAQQSAVASDHDADTIDKSDGGDGGDGIGKGSTRKGR